MATDSRKIDPSHVQILAEHYQKTFELADGLRRDRNNFFIFLVVVLGGATGFFGLGKQKVLRMLSAWISANMGFDKLDPTKYVDLAPDAIGQLLSGSNFALLLILTLAIVFYLMMNLYHHTATVKRLYTYLSELEKELVDYLPLRHDTFFFTREGAFYEKHNTRSLKSIGLAYSVVLSILLVGFFSLVARDMEYLIYTDDLVLTVIRIAEVVVAAATLAYLLAYWRESFNLASLFKSKTQPDTSKTGVEKSDAS